MNEDQSDGRDESIEPAAADSPCDTSNSTPFPPVYSAVAARESASDPGEPQIETRWDLSWCSKNTRLIIAGH